ncbi:MAG: PP2C family protein-serine/threonine phosphatase [bacterium]
MSRPSESDPTALRHELVRAREEIARLSSLIEASQTINSTLELDEVLPRILQTATENVKADRGTLYIVDRERGELWSRVLQGEEEMEIRLPLGEGLSGYVAKTGDVILIEDAYSDPRFNREMDKKTGYRTRSVLTTPMRNKRGEIIGVFQLLNKEGGPFEQGDVEFLDALSAHAAIAIENAFLLKESLRKEALEREMEVARSIQQRLLPEEMPDVEGFEFVGLNTPSEAVGGDYYDFIHLGEGKILVALGDVVGHGVPAALLMANVHAAVRSHAQYDLDLAEMVAKVNEFLHRSTDTMQYSTFFCGVLDTSSGSFGYVNAGHNPPYLVRCEEGADPDMETLEAGGIPLGMMAGVPYEGGGVTMEPGDLLYIFTDGVTEAHDEQGDMMGEGRLEACLRQCRGLSLHNVVHEIQVEIRAHTGDTKQEDDVTMVAVHRLP